MNEQSIFELVEASRRFRQEWPRRLEEAANELSEALRLAGLGIPFTAKIEEKGREMRAFGWYAKQIASGEMTIGQAIADAQEKSLARISERSGRAGFQRALTRQERERRAQKQLRYLQNRAARRVADRQRTLETKGGGGRTLGREKSSKKKGKKGKKK